MYHNNNSLSLNDFFSFDKIKILQVTHGPEKPVLAVLTDKDLLLYPSLPENKESLSNPTKSHPLITTRFMCFLHTHAPHTAVDTNTLLLSLLLSVMWKTNTQEMTFCISKAQ